MRKFGYSYLENEFILNSPANFMVFGGLILFPEKSAVDFIKLCKNNSIKILGIDGFHIIGNKIQPDQNHTSEDYVIFSINEAYEKALEFIKIRKNSGLWFEIVTEIANS